jgi:hypothetical protein
VQHGEARCAREATIFEWKGSAVGVDDVYVGASEAFPQCSREHLVDLHRGQSGDGLSQDVGRQAWSGTHFQDVVPQFAAAKRPGKNVPLDCLSPFGAGAQLEVALIHRASQRTLSAQRRVPLRNRVTPFGEIVALPGRGTLTGNRGVLHVAPRTIVRDSQVRRWIACRLEFRGRHRAVMSPGTWTELFFLDEAAALAAGHRPCAECRREEYGLFRTAWQRVHPNSAASADAIDTTLHAERRVRAWVKRTYIAVSDDLPDGTYVALDDQAWLVLGDALLRWSPDRYVARRLRPPVQEITVLTPPSIVAAFHAGYRAGVHPSAQTR